MEPQPLEQVVRNIDERLSRVEQILPTLATKTELRAAIAPLATRAELREAIAPLATKVELREAIAEAIAPLATKVELREAIAGAIAPLATRADMREEGERTRQHFDVVAERLEGQIRLIAEGHVSLSVRMDDRRTEVKGDIALLDGRVTRLEARRRR